MNRNIGRTGCMGCIHLSPSQADGKTTPCMYRVGESAHQEATPDEVVRREIYSTLCFTGRLLAHNELVTASRTISFSLHEIPEGGLYVCTMQQTSDQVGGYLVSKSVVVAAKFDVGLFFGYTAQALDLYAKAGLEDLVNSFCSKTD